MTSPGRIWLARRLQNTGLPKDIARENQPNSEIHLSCFKLLLAYQVPDIQGWKNIMSAYNVDILVIFLFLLSFIKYHHPHCIYEIICAYKNDHEFGHQNTIWEGV
jgi:hypothetical protein